MTEHIWAARRGDLQTIEAEISRGASMRDDLRSDRPAPPLAGDPFGPGDPFSELLAGVLENAGLDADQRASVMGPGGPEDLWWPLVHAAASTACSDANFETILDWTLREGVLDPMQGASALHEAALRGSIGKVRALLDAGAPADGRDLLGTAVPDSLPYRKSEGALECLRAILAAGTFEGRQRSYLVNQALGCGNRPALELLLIEGDAELEEDLREQHGALGVALLFDRLLPTPEEATGEETVVGKLLQVAACLDRLEVVEAFSPTIRNGIPKALHHGSGADATRVVKWCLSRTESGGDPASALESAANEEAAAMARHLRESGIDVPQDLFAAMLSAPSRSSKASEASIDEIGADGYCALRQAAEEGDLDRVRALLAAGADVNNADEHDSFTALHAAAQFEWAAVAEVLLAHGADPSIEDLDGDRPFDLARSEFMRNLLRRAMG